MPTIIDSLIITLGLDGKNFQKGIADVDKQLDKAGKGAEQTGKKLNKAGKDGAEGFNAASNAAGKFAAAMAALYVIKRVVTDIVQTNAEIYRFSRNLGESTQKISAWSNAIEITGGSAQAFQGTLDMLSRSQTELQMTGQSGLIPYFSRMGISMLDAGGKMKSTTTQLMEITDWVQKSGMQRPEAFNYLRSMGIDSGTANAMLEGRQSLERMIEAQTKHGALTNEQGSAAEKTRRKMAETSIQINAAKNDLESGLNPVLQKALDLFNNLSIATNGWSSAIVTAAAGIGTLAIGMTSLANIFKMFVPGASGAAGAAATGGGTAAVAGGGLLSKIAGFARGSIGGALLFHSGELNKGEDAELAKRRAMGATIDGGDRGKFIAEASRRLGVPPEAIDAQLRLETGAAGNKTIGNFNYGNIKAGKSWAGESVKKNVGEYGAGGKAYSENSAFRSYGDPTAAAADYADMISRRFPGAVGAGNATEFAKGLKSGGYATDPDYVSKISRIAGGIPGASRMASAGAGRGSAGTGGSSNVTTSIGEIKIYTQAKDADGIAREIGGKIDSLLPSNGNPGLS